MGLGYRPSAESRPESGVVSVVVWLSALSLAQVNYAFELKESLVNLIGCFRMDIRGILIN